MNMLLIKVTGLPGTQIHSLPRVKAWVLESDHLSLNSGFNSCWLSFWSGCLIPLRSFLRLQTGYVEWINEIMYIQSLTRTWYNIEVQLRLAIIIFGFINIVLTHTLTSRGRDNGQQVICNRNEVTQFGKKHRMSRKEAQMKPRTTAFGNTITATTQRRQHTLRSLLGSHSTH